MRLEQDREEYPRQREAYPMGVVALYLNDVRIYSLMFVRHTSRKVEAFFRLFIPASLLYTSTNPSKLLH